jgi:hypothetical protein
VIDLKNLIDCLKVKCIKKLKIPFIYSVRKGMVQTLNDAGVAANHIIQISGHKNVNSVNNYSTLNESQQKGISRTFSKLPSNTCTKSREISAPHHYYTSRQHTETHISDHV